MTRKGPVRPHPVGRPPDIAAKLDAFGTRAELSRKLGISRPGVYGLVYPDRHRIPAAVFDARADLAQRIAAICGTTREQVFAYYERAHERKHANTHQGVGLP